MKGASRTMPALLAMLLVLALAAPASASGFRSSLESDEASKSLHDGQTLVRGLFFGLGPVARAFPEFANAEVGPTDELLARVDSLIDRIEREDARFFPWFAASIHSGDRPTILTALEQAQGALNYALLAEHDLTEDDLAGGGDAGIDCLAFWVAAAITLAAVGNVAYAVNLAYEGNVAWTVNWMFSEIQRHSTSALEQDIWVDRIAARLGA